MARPVVCDSVLAEVVGANSVRLGTLAHLLLPHCLSVLDFFTHHALVKPGSQHAHGSVSVLELGATLLTFCHCSCF